MAMAPGAAPAAPTGINLKSPIGGPSGPGSSPMLSPGTGDGMMAQALKRIAGKDGIIDQLLEIGATIPKESGGWNSISRAITALNGFSTAAKKQDTETEPKPLPIPSSPLGGGGPGALGSPGAPPPTGMGGGLPASPGGGSMPPITPDEV